MGDILQKITGIGSYNPTHSYSFEFIDRKTGQKLTEVFLLLPPIDYSIQQGYRINVHKTAGGGWIDDFGNDFKTISLTFDLWFYWQGDPATPPQSESTLGRFAEQSLNKVIRAGNTALATVGLYDMLTGLDEFYKLRYLFAEGRDQSLLSINDNKKHPFDEKFTNESRFKRNGMGDIALAAKAKQLNYSDYIVIYHDYDEQNHLEVVLQNMAFQRSNQDPNSVKFNIEMIGIRPIYGYQDVAGDIETFASPFDIIKNFKEAVDNFTGVVDTVLNNISNITDVFAAFTNLLADLKTEALNVINKVKFNINKLKSIANTFNTYVGISDGVKESNLFTAIAANYVQDFNNYLIGDETIPIFETYNEIHTIQNSLYDFSVAIKNLSWYFGESPEKYIDDFSIELEVGDIVNPELRIYPYYRVKQSDTLNNIALKFFRNINYSNTIAVINNIKPKDFENNGMVGKLIKIPIDFAFNTDFHTKNLVYSYAPTKPYASSYERALNILGVDLKLNNEKGLAQDESGDLDIEEGEACFYSNIVDRLSNQQGVLELHPEWGVGYVIGNMIESVYLKKVIQNIENQVKLDTRSSTARVIDLQIVGDTMIYEIEITNVLNTTIIKTLEIDISRKGV